MSEIASKVSLCRVCASSLLDIVIDFGHLSLTGVFLEDGNSVQKEPLVLCRCQDCGLVQLGHNYSQLALYGDSYGYESHLNKSMVNHLQQKARILEKKYLSGLTKPVVVDIASNDGTLLSGYLDDAITKIGIDPLMEIVSDHYPKSAIKIGEFFSAASFWAHASAPSNLVTSLSVLYDLDDPVGFARQVSQILCDDGIWHFEQSYLPLMLEATSYDTICHEHLLYLSMHDIKRILDSAGFKVIDASINGINGGSIAVTAMKTEKDVLPSPFVEFLLASEIENGIMDGTRISSFAKNFLWHASALNKLVLEYKHAGFDVIGFGASTKGNVLLQAANLDSKNIRTIGDINARKFGKQTPGTCIPIISEKQLIDTAGDSTIAIVLPWHFREGLISSLETYLGKGGKLIFPLPRIEVVSI
jgi:hypothetical protein